MRFSERLIDPKSPDRRPRRAAYALPTLFTAGNIFLGFVSIVKSFQGSALPYGPNPAFELAALLIGIAFALDGLDGRIARMTNTVSDFGREMDSLADVITFGLAPAILAFTWGFQYLDLPPNHIVGDHIRRVAYFACFLFLLCGALRLARFNVQTNPMPRNPGRPDRKYFVGVPIPAAAGALASVVYAVDGTPIRWWPWALPWVVIVGSVALLMVSTWRYRSFKDLNLLRPRSPLSLLLLGTLIFLMWNYSKAVLPAMAWMYVASGVVIRAGGVLRRRFKKTGPAHA
jgi:CDP-diacylglycerol--serine O-phosphatidyltransferase